MSNRFRNEEGPFIVAGPCSIESRHQLQQCVTALRTIKQVKLIRGGVWKPRTRPGGFEGLGEPALRWMQEISSTYPDVAFCCEVARPEHVELCLRYGITSFWIGARTCGNPFSVGELAQAFQGTQAAIMVKNPTSPDVRLWIGAIERIMRAGIENIAAVHRGFFVYDDHSPYRNPPLWEVPIELRRQMPDIPILCDPSHIAGKRQYIASILQMAADLGSDGYMIEVHPSPSDALTDSEQQLTPEEFAQHLQDIVVRSKSDILNSELDTLRKHIDQIDYELISKLHERMQVSRKIASIKAANNMAIFQPQRLVALMQQRQEIANMFGLSTEFVQQLFEKIHTESVRIQEQEINVIRD